MEATIGFAAGFALGAGLMAMISVNAYNKQAEELREEKDNNKGLANTIEKIRKERRNMLVKIVRVNNPKAKHREGQKRELILVGNRAEPKYVDGSEKYCLTSQIKKITMETQNTIYELEAMLEEKEEDGK